MKFAALEGKRVAVWGCGREGRAALAALHDRLPDVPVTLFCREHEAVDLPAAKIDIQTIPPDADTLAGFDIIIKSPGISAYKPDILAAQAQGTVFTSGTALWFGENPQARVIGVTGTKGKSTTSALIAHLSRALGVRTALAGNIGLPLLELRDQHADLWVVELSSFQTGEAGPLKLGVMTSLYIEHLDWHGSAERYVADKLKLADVADTLLVNATQSDLATRTDKHPQRQFFGNDAGWHVDAQGSMCRGAQRIIDADEFPVPGAHNLLNACAALAALEIVGLDAVAASTALADFSPLPHRLQPLGSRDGLHWIDDSISTTPQATLAALRSLPGQDVTVIVGGHDRGLDWSDFAHALHELPRVQLVVQGANALCIVAALQTETIASFACCENLDAAVSLARESTPTNGVIVLSPGAPSFDQFRDYTARGRHFAERAGFEPDTVSRIPGLGVC